MPARDFIIDTLLPSLKEALADDIKGNKHYLAGYDAALKVVIRFLEDQRGQWDVAD